MPKCKVPRKPKGRKTSYSYFVQALRMALRERHPDVVVNFKEFSTCCSKMWKNMSAEQKEPYQDFAELDAERYYNELSAYNASNKKKPKEDPNAPKPTQLPFSWFCHDYRSHVLATYQGSSLDDITINQELKRMWDSADRQTRDKYFKYFYSDDQRYDDEMEHYKDNKNVTSDSWFNFSVSCDHPFRRCAPCETEESERESNDNDNE